jgi:hypothetical protein
VGFEPTIAVLERAKTVRALPVIEADFYAHLEPNLRRADLCLHANKASELKIEKVTSTTTTTTTTTNVTVGETGCRRKATYP